LSEKAGQLAHLDGNPANNAPDNIAFLCLQDHDRLDTRTSQSKGLTVGEVKRFREELLDALSRGGLSAAPSGAPVPDVRVRVGAAIAATSATQTESILTVRVENHSAISVFIRSVMCELSTQNLLFFKRDHLTGQPNSRRELRPGESFDFTIAPRDLFAERLPGDLKAIVVVDDLGRHFISNDSEFTDVSAALFADFSRDVRRSDG
jgi:hypothetical protein